MAKKNARKTVQMGVRVPFSVRQRAKRNLPLLRQRFASVPTSEAVEVTLSTFVRIAMENFSSELEASTSPASGFDH